jgi:hypothetical protein
MANQPEVTSYDAGVYQLEITDPVDGGVGAVSNAPLLALANRTNYLKKHLDDLESGTTIPAGIARIASPAFTGSPTAPTQAAGDNSTKLATDQFVQTAVNGIVVVDISGAATTTLTQAQWGTAIIVLTGAVTANKAVVFPAQSGHWQVVNSTTGNFTVTLKTAAGAGVDITRGRSSNIYCDGNGVSLQQTDFVSPALTGSPTTPTPTVGANNTLIANMAALLQGMAAFGIGAVNGPQVTDLNALSAGGMYYATSSANGLPIAANSSIAHLPYSDGSAALQICSTLAVPVRIYYRTRASGTWNPWDEFGKLNSPAFTGAPTTPTPSLGDTSTKVANMAALAQALTARSRAYASGVPTVTADTTLLPSGVGLAYRINGASALTVTLPSPADVTSGCSYTIRNESLFPVTVTTPVGNIFSAYAAQATSLVLASNEWIEIQASGTGAWVVDTRGKLSETAAINSPSFTGAPTAPSLARFTAGSGLVNADTLKASGIQANTFRSVDLSVATVNLAASDAGSVIAITGSGGGTLVLPAANAVPAGALITIRCNNTGVSTNTLKGSGTNTIGGEVGAGANTALLISGDCMVLVSDGVSKWDVAVEATAAFVANLFTTNQQLTANGYQKLPGGLIMQWGGAQTSASGVVLVVMPVTFTNPPRSIVATVANSAANNVSVAVNVVTNGSFRGYTTAGSSGSVGTAGPLAFNWLAIGY